ncbi:hypothetical protein UlMin_032681 [Ulmus minor]
MGLLRAMICVFLLLGFASILVDGQGTRVGFYSESCRRPESIVRTTVEDHFKSNPAVAPGLLRMHFHDYFVQGCDASLTNGANLDLRGFEVIDDAKSRLEAACPGVVSCADILALAARDSVDLTRGISWKVPTGRRDGRVSLASDVDLPGPSDTIDVQKQQFQARGLDTQDLVTLLGAHTIGTAACEFFKYRLYNFTNTGTGADPTINPSFVAQLQSLCPEKGDGTECVDLDTGSADRFDDDYFENLRDGKGVLESDQRLWNDPSSKTFIQRFLGMRGQRDLNFKFEFGKSMVKMSNIAVKTGPQGEIRRVCSKIN